MLETLSTLLEKASQSMGVAVEQVYQVLMQQAKVELVWDILGVVGIVVGLVVSYTIAHKLYIKERDGKHSYKDYTPSVLLWIIPTVLGGFFGTMAIMEIVQILVNPPVWVLDFLVKMFQ